MGREGNVDPDVLGAATLFAESESQPLLSGDGPLTPPAAALRLLVMRCHQSWDIRLRFNSSISQTPRVAKHRFVMDCSSASGT